MEYSNLISEFVDGTLDKSSEESLFRELSSNEGLRGELKQEIQMERAFSRKLTAFVPTAQSTIGVFSKLGFVAPIAGAAVAVTSAIKSGFFSTYFQGIISAAVATALTGAAFVTLIYSGVFDKNTQNYASNKNQTQNSQTLAPVPDANAVNNLTKQPEVPVKIVEKIKYVYINKNKETPTANSILNNKLGTNTVPAENNSDNLNNDKFSGKIIIQATDNTNKPLYVENTNPKNPLISTENKVNSSVTVPQNLSEPNIMTTNHAVPNNETLKFDIAKPIGITLGITGIQDWQLQSDVLNENTGTKFNNLAISAKYQLSDKLSIGFDMRKEQFYQNFIGNDKFGNQYQYRQTPDYLSYAATLKWNFASYDYLNFFSEVSAGATETGPLGRILCGMEFRASYNYSFYLGVEGSDLHYQVSNCWYDSPKIGLNYGVLYKF